MDRWYRENWPIKDNYKTVGSLFVFPFSFEVSGNSKKVRTNLVIRNWLIKDKYELVAHWPRNPEKDQSQNQRLGGAGEGECHRGKNGICFSLYLSQACYVTSPSQASTPKSRNYSPTSSSSKQILRTILCTPHWFGPRSRNFHSSLPTDNQFQLLDEFVLK